MSPNKMKDNYIFTTLAYIDRYNAKFGNIIFYIGLIFLLLSYRWFGDSILTPEINYLYSILWRISFILFCFRILLFLPRSFPYAIVAFAIIGLALLHYKISDIRDLVMFSSALLASKEADKIILLRIYRYCLILIIAVAYALNSYGLIGETIKHVGNFVGHSYGFVNPNTLGQIIMSISMTILLSIVGCTKRIVPIICIVSALIVWYITLCKTSVVILLLIPVFYYFFNNIGHIITSKLFAMLPSFGLILSLLLLVYYGPSTGDTTFESRFSIPFLLYDDPGLNLFGHWYLPFPVDNCYFYIIFKYGVIPSFCLLLFYSIFLFKIVNLKDSLIISMAFCWFLLGFMERVPLHICFNFLLFYYFCDYHQRHKKRVM